jgi:hypothetical protein
VVLMQKVPVRPSASALISPEVAIDLLCMARSVVEVSGRLAVQ